VHIRVLGGAKICQKERKDRRRRKKKNNHNNLKTCIPYKK
jgi:hypothetical protein